MPTSFPTLSESVDLVSKIRADNPGLDSLNDRELADMVLKQTGDERLRPAASSSALARGINTVGQAFSSAGHSVETAIASPKDGPIQRTLGRVAGNFVSGAPELAAGIGAAYTGGVPRALLALGGTAFAYGRNKAETGSEKAALGNAAGFLAGTIGGIKGAKAGEELAGEGAGALKRFAAGTAGAAVGQAPGDYVGLATQPGETLDLQKFREDPINVSAYLAGQPLSGAALELAHSAGRKAFTEVQKTKAATPDLDSILTKTDADELASLKSKPLAEVTELDKERMRQLSTSLAETDEKLLQSRLANIAKTTPQDLTGMAETPMTLKAQIHLLNQGKKAVVEIPKGTDLPDVPVWMQGFKQHDAPNGSTYLYDDRRTNPAQIDNAVATDSLGLLLGYGTPSVPKALSGEVATLRSKRGTEKASVLLGDGNKATVLKALGDMGLGDDVVGVETPQQVAEWRMRNKGLQKLFSISDTGQPEDDISFTNHVLDMFHRSTMSTAKKGARFSTDANGMLGGKGLLKAVTDWAPAELMEHYRANGIETLLEADKVPAQAFTKWLRENTPEVEVKKLTPFQESSKRAEAQHYLENQGFGVDANGYVSEPYAQGGRMIDEVSPELIERYGRNVHDAVHTLYSEPKNAFESSNDAATGRYGVEPKELSQMPGAVDILVRVPTKNEYASDGKGNLKEQNVLYRGPHFGESDKNVLASIRGYEETLPNGKKVFHVFEVQSDWGQRAQKVGVKAPVDAKTLPPEFRIGPVEGQSIKDFPNQVGLYRKGSSGREGYEGTFVSPEEAKKAEMQRSNDGF